MPTILLKKSDTASSVPSTANLTNLAGGAEVAVNTADKRLFTMNSSSAVVELGTNPSSLTVATGANLATTSGNVGIGTTSPNILSWNKATTLNTATGNVAYEVAINGSAQAYFAADASNVYLAAYANKPLLIRTNNANVATFDTAGNLGLGVTPSAWSGVGAALQVGVSAAIIGNSASSSSFISNAYFDGTNYRYIGTGFAQRLALTSGTYAFQTAASGTAGNAITFTQAMTLDANGNLVLGTTSALSSSYRITSYGGRVNFAGNSDALNLYLQYNNGTLGAFIGSPAANVLAFSDSSGTERARITSTGNLLVGTTTDVASRSGTISDISGNVRAIPRTGSAKTSVYTLSISDVGQYVELGTGGGIDVPNGIFSTGDVVSVFNNTTGARTISLTITTAYLAGTDADKASVSLATRGVATVLFISNSVCVVSGNVT